MHYSHVSWLSVCIHKIQGMQLLLPILDFCNAHALLRLGAVQKSWQELVWQVLVSTVMQSHVSVQKLLESQCYPKPNAMRVNRLVQCNTQSDLLGNDIAKDICRLQICLGLLRSAASVSRTRLAFSSIVEYIRHGLRDDMRGLHVRTIFTLYTQFLPVGFIRVQAPDPLLLLEEDFTDAVANFRQTWTREGNCLEITLWNVLNILVK